MIQPFLCCCVACLLLSLQPLWAKTLTVAPVTAPSSPSSESVSPLVYHSIQSALEAAFPGDTVWLQPGDYYEDVNSVRSGTAQQPIRIAGSHAARLHGAGLSRVLQIRHDYIWLEGFTIDGQTGEGRRATDFRKKLIYVMSHTPGKGITGIKIQRMILRNAADECLRLRYLVRQVEIADNQIKRCGLQDFRFQGGGKNGEGIYIGTAPEQLNNGVSPDNRPDISRYIWIHHNKIATHGNECIDIKEFSKDIVVEYNDCSEQRDPKSGGISVRGNRNIIRFNDIHTCAGAGIRLGGDTSHDGIDNQVYGNNITACEAGGIKLQRVPQAALCGNHFEKIPANRWVFGAARKTVRADAACSDLHLKERSAFQQAL